MGLVDEIRYSMVPVVIGDGIPFFGNTAGDIALHLTEMKCYKSAMVELCYEVKR